MHVHCLKHQITLKDIMKYYIKKPKTLLLFSLPVSQSNYFEIIFTADTDHRISK